MLGLRLLEGVSMNAFAQRFGVRAEERYAPQIREVTELKLLSLSGDTLKLTEHGLFLSNEVFLRLMPATPEAPST